MKTVIRNPKYLQKVREMACVVTNRPGPSDPAHIRHGLGGGMGMKPGDNLVLPLSHEMHRDQHQIGERRFWLKAMQMNGDFMMECVKAYARQLYNEEAP